MLLTSYVVLASSASALASTSPPFALPDRKASNFCSAVQSLLSFTHEQDAAVSFCKTFLARSTISTTTTAAQSTTTRPSSQQQTVTVTSGIATSSEPRPTCSYVRVDGIRRRRGMSPLARTAQPASAPRPVCFASYPDVIVRAACQCLQPVATPAGPVTVTVASSTTTVTPTATAVCDNFLQDGSFEDANAVTNTDAAWSGQRVTFAASATEPGDAQNGKQYAVLQASPGSPALLSQAYTEPSQPGVGSTRQLTFYYNLIQAPPSGTDCTLEYSYALAGGRTYIDATIPSSAAASGWNRVNTPTQYNGAGGQVTVAFNLVCDTAGSSAKMLIDNVSVLGCCAQK